MYRKIICSLLFIFCLALLIHHCECSKALAASKWCKDSLSQVATIPEKVKPVMIFLCLVQAGSIKTYYDVGICMEAMKMLCLKDCQSSEDDREYRSCIFDERVVKAYAKAETMFHSCIGGESQCIKLIKPLNKGHGCWLECFSGNSEVCFDGCIPMKENSTAALNYLHCAVEMNPAHEMFRNCLLQKIPVKLPGVPAL